MKNKPIGVMDSGTGGFSSCLEIKKQLPKESILYYGDLAYLPYGEKTQDFLVERTATICSSLEKEGAKAIVIACNTASAAFLKNPEAFSSINVPIFDVITATTGFLSSKLKSPNQITILATGATVKNGIYKDILIKSFPNAEIKQIATLEWASLVEEFDLDSKEIKEGLLKYIPLINNDPTNNVLLACTHYYYLAPLLKEYLPNVSFYDSSTPVVEKLLFYLQENDLLSDIFPSFKVYTSKMAENFSKMAKNTFGSSTEVLVKNI